jgi:Na+-transporting NADH:ubiquinone oxidoreductase subunit E
MGIVFIMTGLMSMAFEGFTGIKLAVPTGSEVKAIHQLPLKQK